MRVRDGTLYKDSQVSGSMLGFGDFDDGVIASAVLLSSLLPLGNQLGKPLSSN